MSGRAVNRLPNVHSDGMKCTVNDLREKRSSSVGVEPWIVLELQNSTSPFFSAGA